MKRPFIVNSIVSLILVLFLGFIIVLALNPFGFEYQNNNQKPPTTQSLILSGKNYTFYDIFVDWKDTATQEVKDNILSGSTEEEYFTAIENFYLMSGIGAISMNFIDKNNVSVMGETYSYTTTGNTTITLTSQNNLEESLVCQYQNNFIKMPVPLDSGSIFSDEIEIAIVLQLVTSVNKSTI